MFAPAKHLLLTTEKTLSRPYVELGLAYSMPNNPFYKHALKQLEKKARKLYPNADAVIRIEMQTTLLGMRLVGTAVRYT